MVGSHNRFTPKFRFGALFGPNKELETHPAPFLDQLSVLEQKNSRRVPVAILRKSALVEKEIIIQLGSGTSVIEELSGYFFGLQNCGYVPEIFYVWAGLSLYWSGIKDPVPNLDKLELLSFQL